MMKMKVKYLSDSLEMPEDVADTNDEVSLISLPE